MLSLGSEASSLDHQELRCVLPEQVLRGVGDGGAGRRSSAHVGDPPHGVDGVLFVGVVKQAELQPLIVGELHRTWTSNTVSQPISASLHLLQNRVFSVELTDASADVWDVETSGNSCQEVEDQLEVSLSDAGRTVDEEPDVHRVVARLTLKTRLFYDLWRQ